MKKTAQYIFIVFSLLLSLSACDAVMETLGLSSESIKSDIRPELFEDEFLIECAARQTQGFLANEVEGFVCVGRNITSLKGLEQFPNLRSLIVNSNRLANVDLSPFPKLEFLDVSANKLNAIDLSHNPELLEVKLDQNALGELDVSMNPKLESLVLTQNSISTLDTSNNPELEELVLDNNALVGDMRLGALDLSHNAKLINLNLFNNEITNIDVSHNAKLDFLNISNNDLLAIDLLNNTNLTDLRLNNNELTSINLLNANNLDTLNLENNQVEVINLPINGALRFAFLRDNQISCDLGTCNGLSRFRIPANTSFIHLDLTNNLLETDDIDLRDNQIFTELILSGNSNMNGTFDLLDEARELVEFRIDDTNITSLDFGLYTSAIEIFNNYDLQEIDATGAPLDLDTLNLLQNMQDNRGLHPRFDSSDLDYTADFPE